jgi:cation diffusion facilitator CzcD-associated flavoprotein CzcO
MRKQLPPDFDVDKHFNPWYNPFEQRLCFCPSGDFFRALHQPNARVVTDTIETVTEHGIRLRSGETLDADMIITATGLHFDLLSGQSCTVDGDCVTDSLGRRYIWNGCMLEGVPNLSHMIGYTAATWTPGADVRIHQAIKLIRHLERHGATSATPHMDPAERRSLPLLPAVRLNSTYVVSAQDRMPKQAGIKPWVNGGNWIEDVWRYLTSSVTKGLRITYPESKKEA